MLIYLFGRDPSVYEESSGLKSLLDKRDACLGPWVPGRCAMDNLLFKPISAAYFMC